MTVETSKLPVEIGKYRLLQELGRGGMGVVYLSQDLRLDRRVALKVLYSVVQGTDAFHRNLQREARVLASLDHPNIVRVHSLEELEGQYAIDMEFVDGPSAAALVQAGGIESGTVVRLAHDALQALAFCHGQGLIHRDVKPNNILLKSRGTAMLTDFGLATSYLDSLGLLVETSATGNILFGTPRYIPPEAWDGGEAVCSWDVYALGLVMFELLAGRPLIAGTTALSVARELLKPRHRSVAEAREDISAELIQLVDRMGALDPAERIADAPAALHELRRTPEFGALEEQPTLRTPLPQRAFPKKRTRTRIALLLAAGLLLVSGAIAGLVYPSMRPASAPPVGIDPVAAPAGAPTETLATAGMERMLGWAEAEALPRAVSAAAPRSYKAWLIQPEKTTPLEALFVPDATVEQAGELLAFDGQSLWTLRFEPDAVGGLSVAGHWAAYAAPDGGAVTHGDCTGTAELGGDASLFAALTLRDITANSLSAASMRLEPGANPGTDTVFYRGIESASAVVPLLYRELLPRRLPWARAMDARLPLWPESRLKLDAADIPVDTALAGGMFSDTAPGAAAPRDALRGRPVGQGAFLRAKAMRDGMVLCARFPRSLCAAPEIALVFTPVVQAPIQRVPRYAGRWNEQGMLSSAFRVAGVDSPWQCSWKAALEREPEAWDFELQIPYAEIGWFPGGAQTVQRMRLNLQICRPAGAAAADSLAAWGAPELDQVEHGVLIEVNFP